MMPRAKITTVFFVAALGIVISPTNAGIWVAPSSFDVNIIEGCITTETLTIGNDGLVDLNFMIRTRQVGGSGASGAEGGSASAAGKARAGGRVFSVPRDHDFTVPANVPYKPGELIVRFASKANGRRPDAAEKNQILKSVGGGDVKRNFKIVPGLSVVKLPPGLTVKEALKDYNKANGILYAQPDYEVKALSTFPDDPRFNELWGMHNTGQSGGTVDADIDAPEAWDIATGSDDIVVAVIDTGVDYTHPDLAANMWVNEAEFNGTPGVDDDGNGYIDDIYGYDFRNNDGDPWDDHYHGTHVAGTIGAVGDNGQGVAGVCWNVKIMAVKFLSSGGRGWTSDAIDSVEYSTLMGANLSSNSWGGGSYSQALKDAIDAAGAAGMLFVAAAGNDGSNNDTSPQYPSSYDSESLIAVMSTDRNDNKSSFSNYGPVSVDLGAPGSSILSCEPGNQYQYLSGTSMATPHVAGACALLWSMNPTMTNSEVKDILLRTVEPTLPGLCVSEGRLNLYSAILETRAPWIEIEPEEGTIGPAESNDVNVTFDAIELAPGTYEAEIVIISNDPYSPTVVPVTMTVSADDLTVTPAEDFESSGTEGGPFEPGCIVYTLTNNGNEPVNWSTWDTEDWLQVNPSQGVLASSVSIDVNVCISPDADLLDPNLYTEILTFQNTDSNSIKQRFVTLTVKPPDCFTELFDDRGSDLQGLMITFIPDGTIAYYEACRKKVDEFPTDPNGGTYLSLWDDDFARVRSGRKVLFYGQKYRYFYVGSNGYITFGDGDTGFSGTLEDHFDMPRISALFADLDPPNDTCISYKKLGDRVAVTFQDVPLFGDRTSKCSFQVEMFFVDGTIRITWLDVPATACVAGLSQGKGLPPVFFEESDLNGYIPCWPCGDLNRDYTVDWFDLAVFASRWLDEGCGVPYWCDRADLDYGGTVDMADFAILGENWHVTEDWWLQPVSHWKFDEGSGTTAYDSAGDNDGTIYGAQWTTSQIDGALSFDGVDDYVDMGDRGSLEGFSRLTLCAWVYWQDTSNSSADFIVGKEGVYKIDILNSTGEIRFLTGNNWAGSILTSAQSISRDAWYHIAATYDGLTKLLYINGDPDTNIVNTSGSLGINSNHFSVGAFYEGSSWTKHLKGKIDDVWVYDRALSAGEVQQLYQDGLPEKAFEPNPADGANDVATDVILSWSPGKEAISHDVYFGTDYTDVNDADIGSPEYMGNQASTSWDVNNYDPCGLEYQTTYYWRIDEVGVSETYKGDVWSFTTVDEPNSYLISWWKFDEDSGTIAYDSAGNNDGTIYGAQWTTGKIVSALNFDGVDDYVEVLDDPSQQITTNQITLSAWINLAADVGSTQRRIICKQEDNGLAWGLEIFGDGYGGSTGNQVVFHDSDGALSWYNCISSTDLNPTQWYHVAVTDDAGAIKIYINGQLDVSSNDGYGIPSNINAPIIIGSVNPLSTFFFNGTIDDVRFYNRNLSDEEIQQLYQEGLSEKAFDPAPVDGANDVDTKVVLSWFAGKDATSHDVYFGTAYSDVNDADIGSPEYMGNQASTSWDVNNYDPCGLEYQTTYYWRIDEVDASNTYKGDIWSFTTIDEPAPSLVSWWRFDEGSGTTASDSVGGNDGTISGAQWTTGQINGALSFDGNNDYVDVGDRDSLEGFSEVTISAWVYWQTIGSSADFVVGKEGIYKIDILNSTGRIRFLTGNDWAGSILTSAQSISGGAWHHIAATYDGSTKLVYINGNQDTSIVTTSGSLGTNSSSVSIGAFREFGAWTKFFKGKIDDVRVYDRALSAVEVEQLYQDGLN